MRFFLKFQVQILWSITQIISIEFPSVFYYVWDYSILLWSAFGLWYTIINTSLLLFDFVIFNFITIYFLFRSSSNLYHICPTFPRVYLMCFISLENVCISKTLNVPPYSGVFNLHIWDCTMYNIFILHIFESYPCSFDYI